MTWENIVATFIEFEDGNSAQLVKDDRRLLKAFADELMKRIDEHQFWTNTDPTGEMELRAMDVKVYINQLLTEAGAKE